jgi:hypothetical protein
MQLWPDIGGATWPPPRPIPDEEAFRRFAFLRGSDTSPDSRATA